MDRKTLELLGWEFKEISTHPIRYYAVYCPNGAFGMNSVSCYSLEDVLNREEVVSFIKTYYVNCEAKLHRIERLALTLMTEFGLDYDG